jgi:hypothetical protein
MKKSFLIIIAIIFLVVFVIIHFAINYYTLSHPGFDTKALLATNQLLLFLSGTSFFMISKNTKKSRTQTFINSVYGVTLLRLFVCMAAAFIYVYTHKDTLHKPTIFGMMIIYGIYTIIESIAASIATKIISNKTQEKDS